MHGLTEIKAWAGAPNASEVEIDTLKKAFWFRDTVYGHALEGISDEEASATLWQGSKLVHIADDGSADLIRATDHFQESAMPIR